MARHTLSVPWATSFPSAHGFANCHRILAKTRAHVAVGIMLEIMHWAGCAVWYPRAAQQSQATPGRARRTRSCLQVQARTAPPAG